MTEDEALFQHWDNLDKKKKLRKRGLKEDGWVAQSAVREMKTVKQILSMLVLAIMLMPIFVAAVPISTPVTDNVPENWWEETTVDRDGDGIGDMVEKYMYHPQVIDDENTIPLIIDFSYTPGNDDILMLEQEVGYEHQFSLPLIDALAGRIPVVNLLDTRDLPGVVMLELDGMLAIANADARVGHGVDVTFEETGYDGAGTTVAIIDTGLDGNHSSIDDQDDNPETYDPKIIGFYDPTATPELTNGTEIFPYDDHGHGSHCGGTTAGTGAPTYEHVGMAPQAHLVGVKVLDGGGSGSFATVMAGMQWTVDSRFNFNIRAASMSLGGFGIFEWTSSEDDSVNRMANEMVSSGIALFIAAGNNAISAQIGTPGSAEDVITVGALDKDTGIAIYSSQGPTEEGRIKPNIAYMGSSIMSVAANTGDGYTAMSGTSMATPGAAGVGALMLQANPELSPFDLRNMMQETATYRQCIYMAKNEPCAEDLIPKNRQNNVYGHGHTNAYESVMMAAERSYSFDKNITISVSTAAVAEGHIPLNFGESITMQISQDVETIQWRSNHLRDDWSNIHSYNDGTQVTLTYEEIIDQLEHLPGKELLGNHTLSIRALDGTSSSPLITFDIMIGDEIKVTEPQESSYDMIIYGSIIAAILLAAMVVAAMMYGSAEEKLGLVTVNTEHEHDQTNVLEAELVE